MTTSPRPALLDAAQALQAAADAMYVEFCLRPEHRHKEQEVRDEYWRTRQEVERALALPASGASADLGAAWSEAVEACVNDQGDDIAELAKIDLVAAIKKTREELYELRDWRDAIRFRDRERASSPAPARMAPPRKRWPNPSHAEADKLADALRDAVSNWETTERGDGNANWTLYETVWKAVASFGTDAPAAEPEPSRGSASATAPDPSFRSDGERDVSKVRAALADAWDATKELRGQERAGEGYTPHPDEDVNPWRTEPPAPQPSAEGPFGPRLRGLREAKGLGLREAAEKLDISPPYLSRLETGSITDPPAERVVRAMADLYDTNFDALMLTVGRISQADIEAVMVAKREKRWPLTQSKPWTFGEPPPASAAAQAEGRTVDAEWWVAVSASGKIGVPATNPQYVHRFNEPENGRHIVRVTARLPLPPEPPTVTATATPAPEAER